MVFYTTTPNFYKYIFIFGIITFMLLIPVWLLVNKFLMTHSFDGQNPLIWGYTMVVLGLSIVLSYKFLQVLRFKKTYHNSLIPLFEINNDEFICYPYPEDFTLKKFPLNEISEFTFLTISRSVYGLLEVHFNNQPKIRRILPPTVILDDKNLTSKHELINFLNSHLKT